MHGALHGWFRIKWLADFVALAAQLPDGELARLHDRAVALGVGPCSAQALLLGERLLGLALPAALSARLGADRAVRSMVAFGAAAVSAPVPAGAADENPRFGGRLLRAYWQASRDWRYRLELATRCVSIVGERARERLRGGAPRA